jgi:hypothetical protein
MTELHDVIFMDSAPLPVVPLDDDNKDDLLPPPYQPTHTSLVPDKSHTTGSDKMLDFSLVGGTSADNDSLPIDHLFPDEEYLTTATPKQVLLIFNFLSRFIRIYL